MTQAHTTPEIRQQPGDTIDNPISLQEQKAQQIIEALITDVASLFALFLQYQKHHWLVEGPQFRDLHLLLEEHYTATQQEGDAIAERIVTLGGVPQINPTSLLNVAYIEEEPEGVLDLRQMLSNDLTANQKILVKLREHIALARELNDYGTEHLLKTHLRAQELRTQDIMHMLEHETLDEILANGKQ